MFKKTSFCIAMAIFMGTAAVAFAEEAPVYDADSYPPAFDGQMDSHVLPEVSDRGSYAAPERSLTTEQRLARAEQQISNLQRLSNSSKMDSLQTDIQSLRGQVEQLSHQLQQVQNQHRVALADLDKRIVNKNSDNPVPSAAADYNAQNDVKALRAQVEQLSKQLQQAQNQPSSKSSVSVSTPVSKTKIKTATNQEVVSKTKSEPSAVVTADSKTDSKSALQPNVAEEQQIYQTAYDFIKAKKYNEAITALQKMLKKYPSGQFAANSHYWLGDLYGLSGKNDQAAKEFGIVVQNFPESPKVSDAQLKLGQIFAAQFKWAEAKTAFKKVINQYPGTSSSRLAADQLKQIKRAGH